MIARVFASALFKSVSRIQADLRRDSNPSPLPANGCPQFGQAPVSLSSGTVNRPYHVVDGSMTQPDDHPPRGGFARLVPELAVLDLEASLSFWCDILGFQIAYQRPERGFAYLERDGAQVMLERRHGVWETGELLRHFGRGVNFQIEVEALDPLLTRLASIDWPLYAEPEDARYRLGAQKVGQREFLVQDPDGYLLRFTQSLGARPLEVSGTGPAPVKVQSPTLNASCGFSRFEDDWHLSRAFDAGEFVFLSGVTGCHPDYSVADDPETQFREAFKFLGEALQVACLDFKDIVEMTSYHVNLRRYLSIFRKVKDEFIVEPYPAWSCIGTTELITEGTLVEIRVICRRA